MPSLALVDNEDQQELLIEDNYVKCWQAILREEIAAATASPSTSSPPRCPRVWDGIVCWAEADPGETAVLPCPDYVAGFDTSAFATRRCLESGDWFSRPEDPNATWTNYSQCAPSNLLAQIVVDMPTLMTPGETLVAEWVPVVKTTATIGYSVSLITLILAFTIMASLRRLRCPRNVLHMHLFASFMMRAFMSLLKESLFIEGIDLAAEAFVQSDGALILNAQPHGWLCKLVISIWQFFIVANYSWVFMEGLYLHNLIFQALFTDTNSIAMYVVLGWGLPFLTVVPWVTLRAIFEDTYCWTTNDQMLLFLVIRIPVGASMLINFVLFLRIVGVVYKKLQSSISEETRRNRYRRWAKSTLVLVPLFGIHYTLFLGMSFAMGVNPVVEIAWLFCDLFFASFQGAFVAILYCFMNGEVKSELSKWWARRSPRRKGPVPLGPPGWLSSGGAQRGPTLGVPTSKSPPPGALLAPPTPDEASGGNSNIGASVSSSSSSDIRDAKDLRTDLFDEQVEAQLSQQQQPLRAFKFSGLLLRRQMSAPPTGASAMRRPGVEDGAVAGGLVARAVKSDMVQSTRMLASKWLSRSRLGSRRKSPAFVNSCSGRTTHCTIECSPQDDEDEAEGCGTERPLLADEIKKVAPLQRSASAGVPTRLSFDIYNARQQQLGTKKKEDVAAADTLKV
ncbi:parathyroid hormone/parathyroid hormone-related peptide receptor-like [Ischnura elegans]|uniref:parathyroid hormone/parathyroid hormone-related peptide receptor-like n=1 Tax=Ischnura elegans TaxID=197161 RepID=UPI001ED88CFC|nr:parathyroid hormone/parathyroid hormone-related peptide receptor-like [Ischnura elegans]XP_046396914.1 parathyroid hormone/parathyroid hormone-related peptide receptor-like [Ischnura elegans]